MSGWQGWFYSDARDPRLFVPRRSGLGLTLNFAHPAARWVLTALFATMALLAILATLLEARS
ncbi:DUF5808 domain-containing protein [Paractinoplanes lichenicola]|uniref:Peptide ABC transporter substrate-binding protein n=1 Tax=Paractinoplanes lichenicola TaxID=2802976 RepID=A0ABS1VQ22_9ACTN|nr:DUF5808 domain-containing protein [Actinoplanes lichenicola]MBL7256244.1 peptide ABC transporter substrate-binding protein [Actinoplanes lichenicola]